MSGMMLPLSWIITVPCGGFLGYVNGSRIGAAMSARRLAELKKTLQTKAVAHKGSAFQIAASNREVFISVPRANGGTASNAMVSFLSISSPGKFVGRFNNNAAGRALVHTTYGLCLDPSLPTTFTSFTLQSFDGTFYSIETEGLPHLAAVTTDEMAESILKREVDREKVGRYTGLASGIVFGLALPIPVLMSMMG
jgi:hypothetical protein